MAKFGIAIVGAGAWGKNHVRNWYEMGVLRVICDRSEERLALMREQYPGVETCRDLKDVLSREDVTACVVATPASTHLTVTRAILEAGLDALVEKPLALNVSDGEELVRLAKKHERVLMVGHVMVYHAAFVRLQELISSGELGRIRYIYSNRLNLGRIRTEEDVLWSFAPHDVAMIHRLLRHRPLEVGCTGGEYINPDVADVTLSSLRFPDGVRAHIFVSWLHPFKDHRFVVVGDRKMAVLDDTLPREEKLQTYPHRVDWVDGQLPVARRADAEAVEIGTWEPLRKECEHFQHCCETRQQPWTCGPSGVQVLEVLEASRTSLQHRGQPQRLGKRTKPAFFAHETAVIDAGAQIGKGSKVWHHAHVCGSAAIGSDCVLGQNVFVAPRVKIGDGVRIQNNVSVYEGVHLDDHVFCGPSMVFTNVINPRSEVSRKDEFRPTKVGRGATLGANCTIICGATLGEYAFVGAGAVVRGDVPAYALMVGVPAKRIGWMCRCGVRLPDDGEKRCPSCGTEYEETDSGLTPR